MPSSHDPWIVAASLFIAALASYVTLDLAKRVRGHDKIVAMWWWAGGSLAMGTGIWAMHFIAMMAYTLPIDLGYTRLATFASWVAAVSASAVALWVASRGELTPTRLAIGSIAMAFGVCGMHYIGIAAIDVAPGIVWNWWLVAASVVIALVASAAALVIFFWLRNRGGRTWAYQLAASLVMGAAISGMHYTGMAAAHFADGAICLSVDVLSGTGMGVLVSIATVIILGLTLVTSFLDARIQAQAARLAASLQVANDQLQNANEELHRRAFHDPLTGLPNRLLFEDRLRHAVARFQREQERISGRSQEKLAVMFIDLDGFKPVNDTYGHAAGDIVLKEAAQRLRFVARDSDTVARVGGDEFLLMMEDAQSEADAVSLGRRLNQALSQPFLLTDREVRISCSIGIVVFPDHGRADKLVANADAAMYAAKRAGAGSFALYAAHMDNAVNHQVELQSDLRDALAKGQIELHYQPKVDGRRGQIHGVEALLRWNHPTQGAVPPDVFIPLAERFGLIVSLGNWVIEEACRQCHAWADEGVRMRVSINVSAHQLRQNDLVYRVKEALDRHMVDASQLLIEITESVAMEDIKATQRTFEGLASIGVFLSIDDFGTGYSSLSYLRQLPAKQIKIDLSFVRDIEASADARAIVDAVIRLSHAMGLRVVAEGVETQAQSDILLGLNCDELQGFLYARPMSAAALLDWATTREVGRAEFTPSIMDESLN
jgi:diguanylate cyclase (GGDEF)-like protein